MRAGLAARLDQVPDRSGMKIRANEDAGPKMSEASDQEARERARRLSLAGRCIPKR
jgi:hypothetical protein